MIKVCLVDDQSLVREGIKSLLGLAEGIEVVGEASDGRAGLELIAQKLSDVVLLDLRMPVLDGIATLKELNNSEYFPPVLILTTFDDNELVLQAINLGIKGYLLKDVSLDDLVNAIKTLHNGKTLIQPARTSRLMEGLKNLANDINAFDKPELLSEREIEILRLVAAGYSNKEIAKALNLSEGTVKNHVSNILSKMGLRDRTRAVLKALDMGII